jgi:hypothetical protein
MLNPTLTAADQTTVNSTDEQADVSLTTKHDEAADHHPFFYPNNANYHAADNIPYYQANTFADETTRNGSNVKARCTTVRLVTPPS